MPSKRSQILERLRITTLPLITTVGGYNFTAKLIERGWRHPVGIGSKFPAIFIATTSEKRRNDATGSTAPYHSDLSVTIVGYVHNSKVNQKFNSTGVQLDLDKLIEDLQHALYADQTQGGLCTYTDILSVQTDDGDLAPFAGCAISVAFGYYEEGQAQ